MIKNIIIIALLISITPAFADTIECQKIITGNSTVITCPSFTNSQPAPAPYYTNPTPSSGGVVTDFVNTLFNKVDQASVQLAGPNAAMIQNGTSAVQTVLNTGIDFFYALKYLAAMLLGIIVPKVFGVNVPSWLLPAIEYTMLAIIALSLWKHAWKIFFTAIAIGIIIILVFFAGGVLVH